MRHPIRGLAVIVLAGLLSLPMTAAASANAAGHTATGPDAIGSVNAFLSYDAGAQMISGHGNMAGWRRGTLNIDATLTYFSVFGGDPQILWRKSNKCTHSTSCSVSTVTLCAAEPGRYEMYVIGSGPGGSDTDSKSVTVPLPASAHHHVNHPTPAAPMDSFYVPSGPAWRHTTTSSRTDGDDGTLEAVTTRHVGPEGVLTTHTYLRNSGTRLVRLSPEERLADLHTWPDQQDLTLADAATSALTGLYEDDQRRAQQRGPDDAVDLSSQRMNELSQLGMQVGSGPWQTTTLRVGDRTVDASRIDVAEGWVVVAISPAGHAPVAVAGTAATVPALTAVTAPPSA